MEQRVKNIAVAVAGIDEEYQNNIIKGINAYAREKGVNVSYFVAFGGVLQNSRYDVGEYNIFTLANMQRFDGAILMTNTVCSQEMRSTVYDKVLSAGVPAVILDCEDKKEFFNISIDNASAMKEIVRHVIRDHGAKVINYISGPLSNTEADERYQAFVDVMMENSLNVEHSRVYYGEFRSLDGSRAIESFLSSGMSVPDAVICANDAMALTAISELEKRGYRVPEDVIVTGFDNTFNARHHSPALTTVERPLYEAGSAACETICRIIDGERLTGGERLMARPVFSGSCGCGKRDDSDAEAYRHNTYQKIETFQREIGMLNRLTSTLAEAENVEEIVRVTAQHIAEVECEKFYICLCADWQGAFNELESEYLVHGYTDTMSVPLVYSAEDGAAQGDSFKTERMFPQPPEGGGNICYFLPLHFRERCLGYYVIQNSDFPIDSLLCHTMMLNVSNSFENIRQLIHLNKAIKELERLYVMDPLCNIYNRNGFTRATAGLVEGCAKNGLRLMISFIDMDGLKTINDGYGHKEGDFALQRLAEAIKDSCDAGCISARFGGDEFIVVAADRTELQAEEFERRFASRLRELNEIMAKPYSISASIGTCIEAVEEDTKLYQLISRADAKMYAKKSASAHGRCPDGAGRVSTRKLVHSREV